MLARITARSLSRRGRRKLLSAVAVALGITVATVVGTMALDVGDKVNRELRSFGANLTVTPAADGLPINVGGVDYRPAGSGAFLPEADLANLKKIFWRNNILAFAPYLYVPVTVEAAAPGARTTVPGGEPASGAQPVRARGREIVLIGTWFDQAVPVDKSDAFRTGVRKLHTGWKVQGAWPRDNDAHGCLVGRRLAEALGVKSGDTVEVRKSKISNLKSQISNFKFPISNFQSQISNSNPPVSSFEFRVRGIVETGGPEDDQILAPLSAVQKLTGEEGEVRRVEVSALTKPEDDFARSDPSRMSPAQFERWSCSPYVSSIAYQIQQAIPGSVAKPVYRVTETEGNILDRVGAIMALLAGAALATAALAVASMMLATVFERRAEIGLFKSLGATNARVAVILLLEASMIGLAGGVAGYLGGSLLAERLARLVFGTPVSVHWTMLPVAVTLALFVTWIGSALPLARGLKTPAATALRS
ncbi:MAG TPA: ABC transporter permease [Terriglobia bacterium]|nr:ABC transporter permease [Terriglobia bacterium]